MVNAKLAGKVFLLGEYAVVAGNSALVAATQPCFALTQGKSRSAADVFHPNSPVGRLRQWSADRLASQGLDLAQFGMDWPQLSWVDAYAPDQNVGGLGRSTAEFGTYFLALAARIPQLKLDPTWKGAYILYRELHGKDVIPPSGADLVTQMIGGVVEFTPERFWRGDMDGALKQISLPTHIDSSTNQKNPLFPVLLFTVEQQGGRKVATHQHLPSLSAQGFFKSPLISNLVRITQRGAAAIPAGDWNTLGECFVQYGDQLESAGLELETTTEDRRGFCKIPGVLGAKGMGALQADGLLVVVDPQINEADFATILAFARARKLSAQPQWLSLNGASLDSTS